VEAASGAPASPIGDAPSPVPPPASKLASGEAVAPPDARPAGAADEVHALAPSREKTAPTSQLDRTTRRTMASQCPRVTRIHDEPRLNSASIPLGKTPAPHWK